MLLKFRILFTILSAVCIGAIIPIGTLFNWFGALACGLFALCFFILMLLCKQSQELKERKPEISQGDFFNPSDEKGKNDQSDKNE